MDKLFSRLDFPSSLCFGLSGIIILALLGMVVYLALRSSRISKAAGMLERRLEKQSVLLQEYYIEKILTDILPEEKIITELISDTGIKLDSNSFLVFNICFLDMDPVFPGKLLTSAVFNSYKEKQLDIKSQYQVLFSKYGHVYYADIDGNTTGLLNFSDHGASIIAAAPEKSYSEIVSELDRITLQIESLSGIKLITAVSSVHKGLDQACKAYSEARILSENMIVSGSKNRVQTIFELAEPNSSVSAVIEKLDYEKQYYNCILNCDFKRAGELIEERIDSVVFENSINLGTIKSHILHDIEMLISIVKKHDYIQLGDLADTSLFIRSIIGAGNSAEIRELLHSFFESLQKYSRETRESADSKSKKILEYINSNYADCNLNSTVICEKFGISMSYLSRMFKQSTGMGVLDCIHKTRLEHAKRLMQTRKSMLAIANETGYSTPRAMVMAFNRYEGINPSKYRSTLDKSPV
ncbi:MAG: helix-turn-helix domain-containing protein [Clostridiales bacterium]|nr:helix-turn-helix domain-containing protein [Clostridiales bacterium]